MMMKYRWHSKSSTCFARHSCQEGSSCICLQNSESCGLFRCGINTKDTRRVTKKDLAWSVTTFDILDSGWLYQRKLAGMEFVTSGTNGTCVKCFRARVKFSRIYAKNYQFRELLQNNWTEFVLE